MTVDIRGLASALKAQAKTRHLTVSQVARLALVAALPPADAKTQLAGRPSPDADRLAKLTIRLRLGVAARLHERARTSGLSLGAYVLVNNAAIASELVPAPFEESTPAEWRRILDVNVVGTFLMCRAVAPHMRARQWGRIVNVGSGTAFKGLPGLAHYVASKGAIIMLTRTLANELGGDNVLVNVVSPGFTMTEAVRANPRILDTFGPKAISTRAIKREAQPIDVANVIHFFVSEEAGFVTGQNLAADGGSVFH